MGPRCFKKVIAQILSEKREAIIQGWREAIVATYPPDSAQFLSGKRDQFANPVGYTIRQQTGIIFDELIGSNNPEALSEALEPIVRIRAVQEFTPAQATAFVYALKQVVREQAGAASANRELLAELMKFELKIDRLAMLVFDLYTQCRDQMAEIRVAEFKRKTFKLMDQLNRPRDTADDRT
jgi:hypothetical protein